MFTRNLILIPLIIINSALIVSCDKAKFDSILPKAPGTKPASLLPSLRTSSMRISSPNVADGVNPATVTISLRTENDQPIVGAELQLTVSGSDNVIVPCTTSNDEGKIQCWLYSSKAEEKIVRTIGAIELSQNVTFLPTPPIRSTFAIVSSGSFVTMPTGQRVITTLGTETNPRLSDSNGVVRVKTSILSSITE